MRMDDTHRCEWRGCFNRYQHYVECRHPSNQYTVYVCDGHLEAALTWAKRCAFKLGASQDLVVHTNLLNW